jgi:hypothetical protein
MRFGGGDATGVSLIQIKSSNIVTKLASEATANAVRAPVAALTTYGAASARPCDIAALHTDQAVALVVLVDFAAIRDLQIARVRAIALGIVAVFQVQQVLGWIDEVRHILGMLHLRQPVIPIIVEGTDQQVLDTPVTGGTISALPYPDSLSIGPRCGPSTRLRPAERGLRRELLDPVSTDS